ncbi:hypothetical protein KGD83_26570 [Nocardiopsis akebiae]|uniref:Uncharacterized protein n=1 Tax=Nocardiopsis akebiae TaxID=2831968 RepID=A0ABX8C2W1_9ACTN|nr:hypothetical protein [Nocardiopsis akebiae]QUX28730.1 hypothetical protein KGD83_26570 [Nocardiopsis akebiae]
MGWDRAGDLDRYEAARSLDRRCGRLWTVMWSPSMRVCTAFYPGPQAAPSPAGLVERLREVEREVAGAAGGYWSCPVAGCAWSSIRPMRHPCPLPADGGRTVGVPRPRPPSASVRGHGTAC